MLRSSELVLAGYLAQVGLAFPSPQTTTTATPSPQPLNASNAPVAWPKGKQVGIIVGCLVGGAIILFLWAWLLKGRKMFRGDKLLWAQSHFGFSKESREAAKKTRYENKLARRREMEAFWGSDHRTGRSTLERPGVNAAVEDRKPLQNGQVTAEAGDARTGVEGMSMAKT